MPTLKWSPLFDSIVDVGKHCNLLIAPFIQADALHALLRHFDNTSLQVITSWTASSLAAGVSDPDVYSVLQEMGVPLYIHPDIHLKLFVFADDIAFHTSANITARGLGLAPNSNIEIGCRLPLELSDWLRINDLLENSCRVTDEMHSTAKHYANENKNAFPPLPKLVLQIHDGVHPFSRQALPQCTSPYELWEFYSKGVLGETLRAAFIHDLWLYKVTNTNLTKEQFLQLLGEAFRSHPFVKALVILLQEKGELHFGAVNAWITSNCSDRPTPSRWELKPATNRLYNWLEFFIPKITWDVPGSRSMVIYWDRNA